MAGCLYLVERDHLLEIGVDCDEVSVGWSLQSRRVSPKLMVELIIKEEHPPWSLVTVWDVFGLLC